MSNKTPPKDTFDTSLTQQIRDDDKNTEGCSSQETKGCRSERSHEQMLQ